MDTSFTKLAENSAQIIRSLMSAGYKPVEEIIASILEDYGENPSDDARAFVVNAVERALAEHYEAQATWPPETDCDRLDAAFALLESAGILARQDYWCCSTCACGAIMEEMDELNADGIPVRGYVFFHEQATESAVESDGLYLDYGVFNEQSTDDAVAVGHEVAGVLRGHGLTVEWDGTIEKKIHVTMDWKRRR